MAEKKEEEISIDILPAATLVPLANDSFHLPVAGAALSKAITDTFNSGNSVSNTSKNKTLSQLSETEISHIFRFLDLQENIYLGTTCQFYYKISIRNMYWRVILSKESEDAKIKKLVSEAQKYHIYLVSPLKSVLHTSTTSTGNNNSVNNQISNNNTLLLPAPTAAPTAAAAVDDDVSQTNQRDAADNMTRLESNNDPFCNSSSSNFSNSIKSQFVHVKKFATHHVARKKLQKKEHKRNKAIITFSGNYCSAPCAFLSICCFLMWLIPFTILVPLLLDNILPHKTATEPYWLIPFLPVAVCVPCFFCAWCMSTTASGSYPLAIQVLYRLLKYYSRYV